MTEKITETEIFDEVYKAIVENPLDLIEEIMRDPEKSKQIIQDMAQPPIDPEVRAEIIKSSMESEIDRTKELKGMAKAIKKEAERLKKIIQPK